MSLSSVDSNISDLLNNKSFIVPQNQRKYVWKRNNWEELIEDIDLVYKRIKPNHFIGSVVLKTAHKDDGIRSHFSIIDGQQRVLTLTILITAIGYLYAERLDYKKIRGLEIYLLVTDRNGDKHPIVSEEANADVYRIVNCLIEKSKEAEKDNIHIISAEELTKEAKLGKTIKECFLYFVNVLEGKVANVEDIDRYQEIIEGIRYIDVSADTEEDAYTIFEVLNARGQALTDFDLLRNFFLKNSSPDDKDKIVGQIGEIELLLSDDVEDFLKHYSLHRYGIRTNNRDKRSYKVISVKEKNGDISLFASDLLLKARFYNQILTGSECSEKITRIFAFYKSHNQRQYRPLLLGLIHQKELGSLSAEDYEMINEYLYRFFICYKIIGEQASNKLDDIVEKYSDEIENRFSNEVLLKLKESLIKRLPNKKNFINSFKALCYSNKWKPFSGSRRKAKVFAVLEFWEVLNGCTVPINTKSYNIEHCLPDADSEDNARIGNLIILESVLNDQVKNKPLLEKGNRYKESILSQPKAVTELVKKGKFDPDEREKLMAERIFYAIQELSGVNTRI